MTSLEEAAVRGFRYRSLEQTATSTATSTISTYSVLTAELYDHNFLVQRLMLAPGPRRQSPSHDVLHPSLTYHNSRPSPSYRDFREGNEVRCLQLQSRALADFERHAVG